MNIDGTSSLIFQTIYILVQILNQKMENQALPVDVSGELRQLGIHTNAQLGLGWAGLLPSGGK